MNQMQSFLYARNLLIVVEILQKIPNTVGNSDLLFNNFDSFEDFISAAGKLNKWFEANQLVLSQITELDLTFVSLTELPIEICQFLPNLKNLNLYMNDLTPLPHELFKLTKLEILALGYNHIETLPPEISQLSNLKKLRLHNNYQITSLPNEIAHLSNLEILDLSHNKISSLPDAISELLNLNELDLSYNEITSLPKDMNRLSNLLDLNLSNNKITSLPKDMNQLDALQMLDLAMNPIEIPIEMLQMTNLQCLYLGNGNIFWIPLPDGFWESPLKNVTFGIPAFQQKYTSMGALFKNIEAVILQVPDLQDLSQENR